MQKEDFGDFEEVTENVQENGEEQTVARARQPRGKELIGSISQRLGGNRMDILCSDGKSRNCRVPGRYKRRLWLRNNDIVLVVPWEFDDSKGDIIYKYPPSAISQLKKAKQLDFLKEGF